MTMLQKLKAIFAKLQPTSMFDVPVAERRRFFEQLPRPKDDLERSYCQYLCQRFLMRRGLPLLLNCAAILLLPLYKWKLRRIKAGNGEESGAESCQAVLLFSGPSNIVPDSLWGEFDILQERDFQKKLHLTRADSDYLRKVRRKYPLAFYFRLKCMLKLAMYSHAIDSSHPKAIICSEEYSFTCSFLTDYCRFRGVEHINVMHGEKLYLIRDSFVHFDRFYVWDPHYIDLFKDLGAEETQFRIEVPPSLRFPPLEPVEKQVDYTYYLDEETLEQIEHILANLAILRERGAKVAIRIHPLYFSHSKFLCEDPRGFVIERKEDCSIEESLLRTGCAIALCSTVLLQAAYNNIPYAIDDLSNPLLFNHLKEMRYLLLNKPYTLLSELIIDKEKPWKNSNK